MPVLNAASVRTRAGRQAYIEMLNGFDQWVKQHNRDVTNPPALDKAVRDYLHLMFQQGWHQTYAGRMIAAVAWRDPRYNKSGPFDLPLAKQASKGWRNLAPPKSRMALPFEIVAMIINYLSYHGMQQIAIAVWLLFEIYGRPGEIHGLRIQDLVPPAADSSAAHRFYSVTLHAQEVGEVSKTGEFDAAVRLDLPRQVALGHALQAMASGRRQGGAAANASLFSVSQAEVARAWRQAIQALGIDKLGACHVYQLRHSGPSHDYAANLRDLEQIRRRGRWKSWSSVRRYEKGGRLTEQLHKLSAAQRRHAVACCRALTASRHGLPSALAPVCPTRP